MTAQTHPCPSAQCGIFLRVSLVMTPSLALLRLRPPPAAFSAQLSTRHPAWRYRQWGRRGALSRGDFSLRCGQWGGGGGPAPPLPYAIFYGAALPGAAAGPRGGDVWDIVHQQELPDVSGAATDSPGVAVATAGGGGVENPIARELTVRIDVGVMRGAVTPALFAHMMRVRRQMSGDVAAATRALTALVRNRRTTRTAAADAASAGAAGAAATQSLAGAIVARTQSAATPRVPTTTPPSPPRRWRLSIQQRGIQAGIADTDGSTALFSSAASEFLIKSARGGAAALTGGFTVSEATLTLHAPLAGGAQTRIASTAGPLPLSTESAGRARAGSSSSQGSSGAVSDHSAAWPLPPPGRNDALRALYGSGAPRSTHAFGSSPFDRATAVFAAPPRATPLASASGLPSAVGAPLGPLVFVDLALPMPFGCTGASAVWGGGGGDGANEVTNSSDNLASPSNRSEAGSDRGGGSSDVGAGGSGALGLRRAQANALAALAAIRTSTRGLGSPRLFFDAASGAVRGVGYSRVGCGALLGSIVLGVDLQTRIVPANLTAKVADEDPGSSVQREVSVELSRPTVILLPAAPMALARLFGSYAAAAAAAVDSVSRVWAEGTAVGGGGGGGWCSWAAR